MKEKSTKAKAAEEKLKLAGQVMVAGLSSKPLKSKVTLKRRPCAVTNLNFSPEKAGDDRIERADLSLKFTVVDDDIDEVLNAKSNASGLLWQTDGGLMFRDLECLPLGREAVGKLKIGIDDEHMAIFDNAILKKIVMLPHVDFQAAIKCKIRVDPTGHLEQLAQMVIVQDCTFSFAGVGIDKSKNENQGELEV